MIYFSSMYVIYCHLFLKWNAVCFGNSVLRYNVAYRRTIMQNAVKDTKALTVVSQDQMLEKLQHSEVRGQCLS